jgi:MFS transporter, FSR family, fosmidomycin resistance protein
MEFARLKTGLGRPSQARLGRPGTAALLAALAVELADELFDGTKSAAMPLIRHDLALNYVEVGLLAAVPLVIGSIIELPLGVASGTGRRRRMFVLGGGLVFLGSVLAAALAGSFGVLLAALTIFFPASGAFVSLTQATLMDAAPDRRAQHMARWTVAGSIGAVTGPLLVAAVLTAGGSWRLAFVLVAASAAAAWIAVARTGRARPPRASLGGAGQHPADAEAPDRPGEGGWPGWAAAASIVRGAGALRWLLLLQASDLLLDVLTAFLALYLVASAHVSPAVAALGVAVRLGAGLVGDVINIRLLETRDSRRVLRASVGLALLLFPAFLLVPWLGGKLVVLAALTIATAPWYPVLQAELYGSLPRHSGLAVSLSSAASLIGGLGPLVVGLLAQRLGLDWAMTVLCAAPVAMLAVPRSRPESGRNAQS